ncbi:uncharacterized protein C8Q71DRAFT_880637 [Rhodofomes roseus]|uniref:Uncharacterized protein n=1 Tax=Rhodofomes roseus TaxID=34475 RepID=A0ABQ8K4Y4_9APHY|nr:uncharacterized protein C8Q71DRAFT_880637 [Rhodofomes roseus]KAH9832022.1 hypothetical protein C8Q71DRAFT_880637 [Rhodofomes roseus]
MPTRASVDTHHAQNPSRVTRGRLVFCVHHHARAFIDTDRRTASAVDVLPPPSPSPRPSRNCAQLARHAVGQGAWWSSVQQISADGESRPLPPPPPTVAVPRGTPPHDLYLATSRTRAPVLPTFVPCTVLDDSAVAACEEQLMDTGLWEHLAVGDVVCNFGYVPPVPEHGNGDVEPKQEWLLFDGSGLSPYAPPPARGPALAPPRRSTTRISSCPGRTHTMSSPSPRSRAACGPTPIRTRASAARGALSHADVQLTLTYVPTRVRSPHSPQGYAVVRKFVWIVCLQYLLDVDVCVPDFEALNVMKHRKLDEDGAERDDRQTEMISETNRKRRKLERERRALERPQPERRMLEPPQEVCTPASLCKTVKTYPFGIASFETNANNTLQCPMKLGHTLEQPGEHLRKRPLRQRPARA